MRWVVLGRVPTAAFGAAIQAIQPEIAQLKLWPESSPSFFAVMPGFPNTNLHKVRIPEPTAIYIVERRKK